MGFGTDLVVGLAGTSISNWDASWKWEKPCWAKYRVCSALNHKASIWWICLFYLQVLKKMTWETTSAKSVHKFSCRYLIYMSTEQEREYTLTVMHVTEFTTQQMTRCKDFWFLCNLWLSGCSFSQGKVRGTTEQDPWLHWYTLQRCFNMISHQELLQQVRTHQNFWVMAHKSILTNIKARFSTFPLMDWKRGIV